MPLKTHRDELPTLNLTPMIDVVFLLIIFFMVGNTFTEPERNIAVQVPRVNDQGALTPAPVRRTINIDRAGQITLDREVVTLAELEQKLRAATTEYQELGVLVRGDADGPFQNVAAVLNSCRQAGISDMGISVRMAHAANSDATEMR